MSQASTRAEILFHLQYLHSGRQQLRAKFKIGIYDKCSENFKFTTLPELELFPLNLYLYVLCMYLYCVIIDK